VRPAIRVEGLSKRYARYAMRRRFATFKSAILSGSLMRDIKPEESFPALTDLSFEVNQGSTVAIIGANGSGKSTLLKILAGILKPTSGRVEVNGRVAALIELGAGFHPEITGRENIVINGIMLGLARRDIERRMDEIIHFAELEDFIDAPVKTYSSGMYVRLGFSVAVAVEPDVLLVDEVLAVGDEAFSHKCLDRFKDLRRRGRTVLVVTHALELAEQLADEVILIEDGRLSAQGQPREMIDRYRSHVAAREERLLRSPSEPVADASEPPPEPQPTPAGEAESDAATGPDEHDELTPRRWGNRSVEFTSIELTDSTGQPHSVFQTGEHMILVLELQAHEPKQDFVFGIAVRGRDGHLAYGFNTDIERFEPRRLDGAARIEITFPAVTLLEGSYVLDVAVHDRDGIPFDYRRACLTFAMRSSRKDQGIARLEHTWSFEGDIELDLPPD